MRSPFGRVSSASAAQAGGADGAENPIPITVVFAALGDPVRASLLGRLATDGRGTATSLTQITDVSRQAVDRHLRVLAGAGLVESRREGREVVYSLKPATVARSAEWLEELGRTWERRLLDIKALAESADPA
ncbi:MAG: metalloregulator ArsR/SmtB family transcription factor [Trueperaceae bacterium]